MTCRLILFLILANIPLSMQAQCNGWENFQVTDSIFTNPFFGIALTPEADRLNRPYVYLATNVGGVKVYDHSTPGNPELIKTIPATEFGGLNAINLHQDSIWLYVVTGNIWDTSQFAGLAIIDVSDPENPDVLDYYIHPGQKRGAGAVAIKGNYAYLAANQNGLVILDISNKSQIQFISELPLNIDFPHNITGEKPMYNARGIAVTENRAYICYDRGGLRVIDIANVQLPIQIQQYCYSPLIDKATAYNNIVIYDQLAYVALDYYGMEILDISNPDSLFQIGYWHPDTWADATTNYNIWANSKGHANEIAYDPICKMIYLAAGKSDALAIDVHNPSSPVTCETYGSTEDVYGTWGLDLWNNQLHIAYIWSPAFPPYSNYTGHTTLQINCQSTPLQENQTESAIKIYPNPGSDFLFIEITGQQLENVHIYNSTGSLLHTEYSTHFSIAHLVEGMYYLHILTDKSTHVYQFVKM